MESIGYAIDFKEVKRVGLQWIDDILDHGMILNRKDLDVIEATQKTGSKLWLMSLNGKEYCNPSAENISKEIFLAMEVLFADYPGLQIHEIELFETPNCSVKCWKDSISVKERENWMNERFVEVDQYRKDKGILEYDDRK
jgi:6-pyruvoyltetrahydropterin/6-carboxytetrahydropterin synthase